MGSFSIWHWLIVLAIVLVIFGTKKLRNMGGDLGGAIKNFKQSMSDEEKKGKEGDGKTRAAKRPAHPAAKRLAKPKPRPTSKPKAKPKAGVKAKKKTRAR